MKRGLARNGMHLYPAFPYTSYARMTSADIADLWAYLQRLPAVAAKPAATRLSFPLNIRRGIGLWNLAFLDEAPEASLETSDPQIARGQYLVEALGHCGQCHTPRNIAGAMKTSRWLAGAIAATGEGRVPNITSGEGGIGDWSASDISYYLASGFTPSYDSVGGAMVEVQKNLSHLPENDLDAIAAYLKAVPPGDSDG